MYSKEQLIGRRVIGSRIGGQDEGQPGTIVALSFFPLARLMK